jgi:flagellar hook-length control protein FliK
MIAMLAPAPVAADTVKLIPTNPNAKPRMDPAPRAPDWRGEERDAPRFDDALKQAQGGPRRAEKAPQAEAPERAQRAQGAQNSAKSKALKRLEEPSESPAPPEQTSDVSPNQAVATDAEGANTAPADQSGAEITDALPEGSLVDLTEVAAVAVAPHTPAAAPDADRQSEAVDAEAGAPAPITAGRVRVMSPQETAQELSSGEGAPQRHAATSTSAPARVDSATQQAGAPAIEEHPEPEPPTIDSSAQPAPQRAATATTSTSDVDVDVAATAATATQPALAGDSNASGDDATPQDQPAARSGTVLDESVEPAAAKLAPAAAPAQVTASASVDAVDALAATVKSAPAAPSDPTTSPAPGAPPAPSPRELEFAQANHDRLVTAMRAQLLPRGGTMQIRLDPPELGSLQVAVHMLDGVMSVSFETSNDQATQLLSHSLTQLKHVLESQGVAVDRLHVQQAPRGEQSSGHSNDPDQQQHRHGAQGDEDLARQEQQRKEMLRRMWRRLALGSDPLDLVA